jgi:hypothetical protein
MTPLRFPPRHWTVEVVEDAVASLDRYRTNRVSIHAADIVRPEVLSSVEPWLVLAVPEVGARVFVPGEQKPRLLSTMSLDFDELIRVRWLPDARAWLLRESGYALPFELEALPSMTAGELEAGRISSGLTQAGLARLVGVSRAVLQRWEHGARAIPDERAQRIREILGPVARKEAV